MKSIKIPPFKNELNTKINLINVGSTERSDSANAMVSSENRTEFYKVPASSATIANNFPENSAGELKVSNLYGVHVIQVFTSLEGRIYTRSIKNYTQSGASWSAWNEK